MLAFTCRRSPYPKIIKRNSSDAPAFLENGRNCMCCSKTAQFTNNSFIHTSVIFHFFLDFLFTSFLPFHPWLFVYSAVTQFSSSEVNVLTQCAVRDTHGTGFRRWRSARVNLQRGALHVCRLCMNMLCFSLTRGCRRPPRQLPPPARVRRRVCTRYATLSQFSSLYFLRPALNPAPLLGVPSGVPQLSAAFPCCHGCLNDESVLKRFTQLFLRPCWRLNLTNSLRILAS